MTMSTLIGPLVGGLVSWQWLSVVVLGLYGVASVATFVAYARDKAAATKGRRRTKETTLHLLSLVGGWPGALVAQAALRHKTQKREFRTVFWITVAVNCVAVVCLSLV